MMKNMNKIIFFGAGKRLKRIVDEKPHLIKINEVLFAVDNNSLLWGQKRDGIIILQPERIVVETYDYVVITCVDAGKIYEQLIGLEVPKEKIISFNQFMLTDRHGEYKEYGETYILKNNKTNFCIVAVKLAYNGGAVAVMNAAKALKEAGYNVIIAAPDAEDDFLEDLINNKLSIFIMPGLDAPTKYECEWISKFDYVFVNSFIMLPCVIEFQKFKPVIWWLHESSFFYPGVFRENPQYYNQEPDVNTKVLSVSGFAKKNFEVYYPGRVDDILPLAIKDVDNYKKLPVGGKCVFAFVGEIIIYKGIHSIIEAFEALSEAQIQNSELWIIGRNYNDEYGIDIAKRIEKNEHIKHLGVLSQAEVDGIYDNIDAHICASPEEMLPTVCIEAMKHGRLCIVSNGAGITEYLTDGKDSFIFDPNDITALSDRMSWVINHREEARIMGNNARQVFLEHLTSDVFVNKVNNIIKELSGVKG